MTLTNNPQTMAKKIGEATGDKKLIAIGKWGCCAFTALWIAGLEDPIDNICTVAREIGKGLDEECTVYWGKFYRNVTGKNVTVIRQEIRSLEDVKGCGRCAVRYDWNGKSHWVGVEDGEIKYNSLEKSFCVENGKPRSARIVKF